MDECKINHFEVDCSREILCEVDLPKAIESARRDCWIKARQAHILVGKHHVTPLFWAYSHTLPQWVELLVSPLVKSLSSKRIPQLVVGWDPPRPQPLETHFWQGGRGSGLGWLGLEGQKKSKK